MLTDDLHVAEAGDTTPPDLPPAANGAAGDIPSPADYAARRYLEYAMSVVTGRALPSAADGQKPVQRRILYAMHRMGLYKSPRHVKGLEPALPHSRWPGQLRLARRRQRRCHALHGSPPDAHRRAIAGRTG